MTPNIGRARQAGAIAVRRKGESFEVCLIRRIGSRKWGIPKGFIEAGHSHEETALKETWEEAGLRGRVVGDAIGTYEFEKRDDAIFAVAVYLMEVHRQYGEWPEADRRERWWASFDEAAAALDGHPVLPLLRRARRKIARGAVRRRRKTRTRRMGR